jgi:hypothetical protein
MLARQAASESPQAPRGGGGDQWTFICNGILTRPGIHQNSHHMKGIAGNSVKVKTTP